jgi:hypothetical protein
VSEGIPPEAIAMTMDRVICMVHWEPFRARWPTGYPIFMVDAFSRVLGPESAPELQEKLWADARAALRVEELPEDPKLAIEAALDRTPLCCRLPDETLLDVYAKCGVGVPGRCAGCGRRSVLGAPFSTVHQKMPHVCFRCVVKQAHVQRARAPS